MMFPWQREPVQPEKTPNTGEDAEAFMRTPGGQPTLNPSAERMAVRVVSAMLMMTLHLFFVSLVMI